MSRAGVDPLGTSDRAPQHTRHTHGHPSSSPMQRRITHSVLLSVTCHLFVLVVCRSTWVRPCRFCFCRAMLTIVVVSMQPARGFCTTAMEQHHLYYAVASGGHLVNCARIVAEILRKLASLRLFHPCVTTATSRCNRTCKLSWSTSVLLSAVVKRS